MEDKQRVQGEQFVLINEKDAVSRKIKNGDKVMVFNDRGSYEGIADLTDDVNQGIIVSHLVIGDNITMVQLTALVQQILLTWVMHLPFQIIWLK